MHRRCMPSGKKLDLSPGTAALICSRTMIPCLHSCTRTMIQCLQGVLQVVQMHRLVVHHIPVWLLTGKGYTHTALRAFREVKSSAVTGLIQAFLASELLSATTEIFCLISIVRSPRRSEAS